jgi:hypothetical protein
MIDSADWLDLALEMDWWCAVVNIIMKFQVP